MAISRIFSFEDTLYDDLNQTALQYNGGFVAPLAAYEDGLTNLGRCYRSRFDLSALGFYFDPSTYGVSSNSTFSISFWVKFITTDGGDPGTIARMYSTNDSAGFDYALQIDIDQENNSLKLYLQHYQYLQNGSLWDLTKYVKLIQSATNTFSPDTWHLITITQDTIYDASAAVSYQPISFYIDANLIEVFNPLKYKYGETYNYQLQRMVDLYRYTTLIDNNYFSLAQILGTSMNRFYMGGYDNTNPINLNIDDLRFYNETIPIEEIQKIYFDGNGRKYSYPCFIKFDNVPSFAYLYKSFQQQNYLEPPIEITILDGNGIQSFDWTQTVNGSYYNYSTGYTTYNFEVEIVNKNITTKVANMSLVGPRGNTKFIKGKATIDAYFTGNLLEGESIDFRFKYFIYSYPILNSTIGKNTNPDYALRPNYLGEYDINGSYSTNDIISYKYKTISSQYVSLPYPPYSISLFKESEERTSIVQAKKNVSLKEPMNFSVDLTLNSSTVDVLQNTFEFSDERFKLTSYLSSTNNTFVKIEGDDLPIGLINSSNWNSSSGYIVFDIVLIDGIYFTCLVANTNKNPLADPPPFFSYYSQTANYWIEGIYKFIVGSYGVGSYGLPKVKFGKYNGTENNITSTGSGNAKFTFFSLGAPVQDNINWNNIATSVSDIPSTSYLPTFFSEPITLRADARILESKTLFISGIDTYKTSNPGLPLVLQLSPNLNNKTTLYTIAANTYETTNPGLPLVLQLSPDLNSNTTLFIYGEQSISTTLFINGHSTQLDPSSSPIRTLFIKGFNEYSNTTNLYIGADPKNEKIPLFIKVVEPVQVTNSTPLYINSLGIDSLTQIIAGRSLYIEGQVFSSTMNLFMLAQESFKFIANVNMFIRSELSYSTNSSTLFLQNDTRIKSNTFILTIKTEETSNGALPFNQSLNMYIERTPSTSNTMSMYINGYSSFYLPESFTMYISNNLTFSNSTSLAMPLTKGLIINNTTMYIRGF
jgi:hypothetical protein